MKTIEPILYHTIREYDESLNEYLLILQEQGTLNDSIYFNLKEESDCQVIVGNEFNRMIPLPSKHVGFINGYDI